MFGEFRRCKFRFEDFLFLSIPLVNPVSNCLSRCWHKPIKKLLIEQSKDLPEGYILNSIEWEVVIDNPTNKQSFKYSYQLLA